MGRESGTVVSIIANCGNKLDKWRRITIIQAMYDNGVDKLRSVVLV